MITVIVVDRLLAWREHRQWKDIRGLVELQSEAALGDFLRAWSRWLAQLRAKGTSVVLSETALETLAETKQPAKSTLPAEDFEQFLVLCAGDPIPTPGESAFIDVVRPRNFHDQLFGYLVSTSLDRGDDAWRSLVTELQALIPRLANLAERIPDKAPSSDVLAQRQFIEGLFLLIRKIDPALYDHQLWDQEISHLDRADSTAHNITGAIMLMKVFRTSRLPLL